MGVFLPLYQNGPWSPMNNPTNFQQNWFRCSQGCEHSVHVCFHLLCRVIVEWPHDMNKHQVDLLMRRETTDFPTSLRGVLVTTAGDHFFIIFISKMVYRSLHNRKFQGQCWQCLVHDRNKN